MDHDFLVIGGGIAGASAAASLAPLGRVLLLEAEAQFAYHASGRSAALYEPHYGPPAIVALSLASGAAFHGAADPILTPRGMLMVAGAGERAAFDRDAAVMELTPIDIDAACALFPILNPAATVTAAHADHAWDIDTDRFHASCLRSARASGAVTLTRARVTAIARAGGGWAVTAGADTHRARIIVNAAGAWADEVGALAGVAPVGLTPKRRSMARIPAPAGHDVTRWPMVFGAGETWYAKPDAGALIVSPADADPLPPQDAWADDIVLAEGLARYEAMVTAPVTRLISSWAGLRTFAPDGSPVIGFDPAQPGFFWLAGQGGYGFQSAPAIAALVADIIAGRAPEIGGDIAAAVSPVRFR
jgi:glycine/D-amino acid oxidase-like deaminating enzyme